jgi:hypothetical protein
MAATTNPSLNEIGHYVVTSHPPGAVLSAVKCDFFGDGSLVSYIYIELRTIHYFGPCDDLRLDIYVVYLLCHCLMVAVCIAIFMIYFSFVSDYAEGQYGGWWHVLKY